MLSTNVQLTPALNPSSLRFTGLILLLLLLTLGFNGTSTSSARTMGLGRSHVMTTHSNFFRFTSMNGRQWVLSCGDDPTVCSDRERNPWGGDTCCFRRTCSDTLRDMNNCGGCGISCSYGMVCCGGRCVDVRNDPNNCGSCFEECPAQNKCVYAMCNYSR